MDEVKFPLKAARLRARVSLVKVAAEAGCTPNTVMRFEVAPESVTEHKRAALEAVYGRLGLPPAMSVRSRIF